MSYYVSPDYEKTKLENATLDDKVDVFESQMRGWYLDHARALTSEWHSRRQHAGFAILAIIGVYFEAVASYIHGRSSEGRSKAFFATGFSEVFPALLPQIEAKGFSDPQKELRALSDTFYREVRCGIFHDAMTRRRVTVVGGEHDPLQIISNSTNEVLSIQVNPFRMIGTVQRHLDEYVLKLRDPNQGELRLNFEAEWDRRAGT